MTIESWRAVDDPPMEDDILKVLGVDDYLSRAYYRPDGAAVGLYMGFYNSQRQGDTIHSPLNCLPGAGWEPVSEGRLHIAECRRRGPSTWTSIATSCKRVSIGSWCCIGTRATAASWPASTSSRLFLIHDAIRLNRTDGSMVRVIAPVAVDAQDGGASAERLAIEFVRTLVPHLSAYLPS